MKFLANNHWFLLLFLFACQAKPAKTGLKIQNKKLVIKETNLNEIELNRKNLKQSIKVNEDGINRIEYYFSSPKIKSYLNTWITITKSGSVNYEESNYLDHKFISNDNSLYLKLRFKTKYDPDAVYYLLYSDYDTNFVSKNKVIDTMFFDMYGEIEIKLAKIHNGDNIVRAKVYMENKKKKEKRLTYFEKEVFVEYE